MASNSPAASPYVTAVGGTTLTQPEHARGFTETAWCGAGSGCSAYERQARLADGPRLRASARSQTSSAVADPNTGVDVYDSNCNFIYRALGECFSGWGVVGGTSAASPIVASVYALAGNAASVNYGSYPYSHTAYLFDVTSGSNGSCGGSYLCTAEPGYDGPSGLGTPRWCRRLLRRRRTSGPSAGPLPPRARGPPALLGNTRARSISFT